MPHIDLIEAFDKFDKDYNDFHLIENPVSNSPDLCAFILLDKLVPAPKLKNDIVSSAEHDIIYLGTDCVKLAEVATEEDILYLRRCGVMYDTSFDCLAMFV